MSDKQYTSEDFKAMKKALGLKNKDIANIIGTGETNVKIQTAPGKPLATWAKAFCWTFEKMKRLESEKMKIHISGGEKMADISEQLVTIHRPK